MFFINLFDVSDEAMIQVVQDKILDVPLRSSLAEDTIPNIVEYKDETLKCAEDLDPKIQSLINEIVAEDSGELILVPILAKERRSKHLYFTVS